MRVNAAAISIYLLTLIYLTHLIVFKKKSRLWAKLQQRLGEQRIDIIIAANKPEERQEIEHVARKTGIRII